MRGAALASVLLYTAPAWVVVLARIFFKEALTPVKLGALVLTQAIGIPCTLLFGRLAGRIGARAAVLAALAVYLVISVLGYFMSAAWHFYVLAGLVGYLKERDL